MTLTAWMTNACRTKVWVVRESRGAPSVTLGLLSGGPAYLVLNPDKAFRRWIALHPRHTYTAKSVSAATVGVSPKKPLDKAPPARKAFTLARLSSEESSFIKNQRLIRPFPTIFREHVRLLWHADFWDGPVNGLCQYDSKKYWFEMSGSPDAVPRRFFVRE